MSALKFPGSIIDVEKSGGSSVVYFLNVPWPSTFPLDDLSYQEEHVNTLWWKKHAPLAQPSALMDELLRSLAPYDDYTGSEILAHALAHDFSFEDLATEQVAERLQLMPRWNQWNGSRNPGFYWSFGRHFCPPSMQSIHEIVYGRAQVPLVTATTRPVSQWTRTERQSVSGPLFP